MDFCRFYISQGSVATQLRYGGVLSNRLITNFPQNAPVKEIENRSIFGKDMEKRLWLTFLSDWRQTDRQTKMRTSSSHKASFTLLNKVRVSLLCSRLGAMCCGNQDVMSTLFTLWQDVKSTVFCVLLHLFVHLDFISLKCSFLNSLSSAVELNETIASFVSSVLQ